MHFWGGPSSAVRARRIPPVGDISPGGPDLGAVDHVHVAVAYGPGAQRSEVRTSLGLAEQLAPALSVIEHGGQEAGLLLLGAASQDRRPGPAHADGGAGQPQASSSKFVVDDQLGLRIGVPAPWAGPVGGDEATLGQVLTGGLGMVGQPSPDLDPTGVVVRGKGEVHGRTVSRTD